MDYEIGFISGRIVFLLILTFALMTLIRTKNKWNDKKVWKSFGILIGFLLLIQVITTSIHSIQLLTVLTMLLATIVFNIKSKSISKN